MQAQNDSAHIGLTMSETADTACSDRGGETWELPRSDELANEVVAIAPPRRSFQFLLEP